MVEEIDRIRILEIPFELRQWAPKYGARWNPTLKAWCAKDPLREELRPFEAKAFSLEALKEALINKADPLALAVNQAFSYRGHQKTAKQAIIEAWRADAPGFLLADEVGLGKTYSAWGACLDIGAGMPKQKGQKRLDVLIACPLSVIPHWRRAITAMGTGILRPVIINYEKLDKLFRVSAGNKGKVKTKKGVAKMGEAPKFAIALFDESHKLKNPTAARSKLAAKIGANADFCLWLSATAGQNPLELSYLATLLAHSRGLKISDLKDFERWCLDENLGVSRGDFGKWLWSGNKKDQEKVRVMLFEGKPPFGLRRLPQEIAGWPEIERILHPQPLAGEERALYDETWKVFMGVWRSGGWKKPPGKMKDGEISPLIALLRARQKSSLLRTKSTALMAGDFAEQGKAVAISCAFIETAEELRKNLEKQGLSVAMITGRMSLGDREANRERFQRDEADVCVFTVEEGISLHQEEEKNRKRALLIHDLRWSAIQMAQIEGRCHRDGKFCPAYWLLAEDSVEERVGAVVAQKAVSMKKMLGDDAESMEKIADLLRAAFEEEEARRAK